MPLIPLDAYTAGVPTVTTDLSVVTVVVGEYLRDWLNPIGVNVYPVLPAQPVWPAVRPTRIGGVMRNRIARLDEAIIDVDCWTTGDAETLATQARDVLLSMGGVRHRGIVVTRAFDSAGPAPRPEEDKTVERYGFTVGLLFHRES